MVKTFQAKIVTHGLWKTVYKNINWKNPAPVDKVAVEIEANKGSLKIKTCCCAIKLWLGTCAIVKSWPYSKKDIKTHMWFFVKEKQIGKVDGSMYSVKLTFFDIS